MTSRTSTSIGVTHTNEMPTQRITQIWLSDGNCEMGDYLLRKTQTIKAAFPKAEYRLFTNDDTEEFIEQNFSPQTLSSYRMLMPYAYKADLARYCILYQLGGWYADLSISWLTTLSCVSSELGFLGFRDISTEKMAHACSNGLFYTKPGHPALRIAIEKVISNCAKREYGATWHCVTGPGVLGSALAEIALDKSIVFGDFIALTPNRKLKNYAYILPDGQILAFWKPSTVSLNELGAKGTNSYSEMWIKRTVFKDL